VSVFIWDSVKKLLPKPEMLYEVKLHSTDKLYAIYRGEVTA
jgi:6-pyruvoyltetrahydropterin/6-carboxytetrahydropterin synthase